MNLRNNIEIATEHLNILSKEVNEIVHNGLDTITVNYSNPNWSLYDEQDSSGCNLDY